MTGGKARIFDFVFGDEDAADGEAQRGECLPIDRDILLAPAGETASAGSSNRNRRERTVAKAVAAAEAAIARGFRNDGFGRQHPVKQLGKHAAMGSINLV